MLPLIAAVNFGKSEATNQDYFRPHYILKDAISKGRYFVHCQKTHFFSHV